jgi:hypothetical protein
MGWKTAESVVDSRQIQYIFLFTEAPKLALRPKIPSIQWIKGLFLKRKAVLAKDWHLSNAVAYDVRLELLLYLYWKGLTRISVFDTDNSLVWGNGTSSAGHYCTVWGRGFVSRISSKTAVWNQYRQYFSGFPSLLCASTKEMRNTTMKNRIIGVHCKQLLPAHHVCCLRFNIFVFPNTFLPPSFTSSCSHIFLSTLLPLLSYSFQIFFISFHSYVFHSHTHSSPLPTSAFSILLFSTLYSSFLSSFMFFFHFLLLH